MIHLAYANRFEPLAGALVDRLEAARAGGSSPLDPVEIVVPHPIFASRLKLSIATRAGIAANLRFGSLHDLMRRAVDPDRAAGPAERADPAAAPGRLAVSPAGRTRAPDRRIRIAGAGVVEIALIALLGEPEVLASAELAPVARYLEAAGDDRELADLRRAQFARRLARVFEEYVLTRPDLVERLGGSGALHREADVTERWERAIWHRLFGPGGRLDPVAGMREGDRPVLLVHALEAMPLEQLALPPALHIFGATRVMPAHHAILARIAQRIPVHIYALNPCRELWGDVDAPDDAAPLRLWGRAGREAVRLLNDLSGFDAEDRFEDPLDGGPPTLLARLQHDVLVRNTTPGRSREETDDAAVPGADPAVPGADESIQVLGCPSVRREVEAVCTEIWRLVARDPALAFNEIAVVLAGRERSAYRTHLGAVFAECHDLPYHEIEAPLAQSSRMVEAIELLLALPASRWTRQDLLRLLLHPAIATHVAHAAPEEWVPWLDALAIVHGADHTDHEGTYIEKDLYNWDQGLRRLALGAFMSGEKSGDGRVFEAGGHAYLPYESGTDRTIAVAELVALVRSLIADARYLRRGERTLSEWAALLGTLVTAYLRPTSDQEERDLHRCLTVIRDLEALDAQGARLSFRIVREVLGPALAGLQTNRGQPLAEGVVVGPLGALSALPFKVVFVLGLGEGLFPSAERRSPLDLRSVHPHPGDVSARERETYAFLERLLATQDRIYLSYVARDARTGDALEPAAVVLELLELLDRDYLRGPGNLADKVTGPAGRALIRRHPLRRWDPRYEADLEPVPSPSARAEVRSRRLRADLMDHLTRAAHAAPCHGPGEPAAGHGFEAASLDLDRLRRALTPEVSAALSPALGLVPIPRQPAPADAAASPGTARGPERVVLRVTALRRFLEDPHEGWKRFVLRLQDGEVDDDPLAREHEPFAASPLEATVLLRELLLEKARRDRTGGPAASFAEVYDAAAAIRELRGTLPTGIFAAAERQKHLEVLERWYRALIEVAGAPPRLSDGIAFGALREHTRAEVVLPPLTLELDLPGRRVRVEIHGRTEQIVEPGCSVVAVARGEPDREALAEQYGLRGFLDHVLLSALERTAGAPYRTVVLFASGHRLEREFSPWSAEDSRAYLAGLASDLLGGVHPAPLPFHSLWGWLASKTGAALDEDEAPAALGDPATRAAVLRRLGPYIEHRRVGAGEAAA